MHHRALSKPTRPKTKTLLNVLATATINEEKMATPIPKSLKHSMSVRIVFLKFNERNRTTAI